jgi:sugar diacid utilization regulator
MTAQNALVFHDDEQIVLLLSAATATSLDRSVRAICDAADDLAIFAGASNIYDTSAGHLSARSHAAQAAEALSRRGRYGLMRHRDMGIELLLQSRGRKDVLDFTLQILGPLLQDARNRSLYDTLLRYVRESKSAARTAEALQIHTNTLYQRLQRIETLIGYDLGNAESFTLLSLACQLHSDYMENGL